jgi:hypothetical protein
MAINPRKRAIPGRPMDFPAEVYNEMLVAITERLKGNARGWRETSTEISIRNDTGSPMSQQFGILAVGEPLILQADNDSEFASRRTVKGTTPSTDSTIAILMEPASADAIVKATILGLTPCKIDLTDTSHRYAGPTTSTTELTSQADPGPAKILWTDTDFSSTGTQWAIVLLMNAATSSGGGGGVGTPTTFSLTGATLSNGQNVAMATVSGLAVGLYLFHLQFGTYVICSGTSGMGRSHLDATGSGHVAYPSVTDTIPHGTIVGAQNFLPVCVNAAFLIDASSTASVTFTYYTGVAAVFQTEVVANASDAPIGAYVKLR